MRRQPSASNQPASHQLAYFAAAAAGHSSAASSAEGSIHTSATLLATVALVQPRQSSARCQRSQRRALG